MDILNNAVEEYYAYHLWKIIYFNIILYRSFIYPSNNNQGVIEYCFVKNNDQESAQFIKENLLKANTIQLFSSKKEKILLVKKLLLYHFINKNHCMNESFESEDICNYSESPNQKEEEKEELSEKKTKSEITKSNNSNSSFTSNDSEVLHKVEVIVASSDEKKAKKKKRNKKNETNKRNDDKIKEKKKENDSIKNDFYYEDPRNKVNWFLHYLIQKFQANFHLGYDLQ